MAIKKEIFSLAKIIAKFTEEESINGIHIYSTSSEDIESFVVQNGKSSFEIKKSEQEEVFENGEWIWKKGEFYSYNDWTENNEEYKPISEKSALKMLKNQRDVILLNY